MKTKKIIYLSLLAGIFAFAACSDFLEQSSPQMIRPVTVEHYKELLQGETYFKNFYRSGWNFEMMSDDVMARDPVMTSSLADASLDYCKTLYRWEPDLEIEGDNNRYTDKMFKTMYQNILTANLCIESADKAVGTSMEKQVLTGQASFVRAYGYFVLANFYAKPYDAASVGDLCVPIQSATTPSVARFPRAKMSEVWKIIWDDINVAIDNLETDPDRNRRTAFEINYRTTLILGSRIALYMGKYDKVIEFGEKYLTLYPTLYDITGITGSPTTSGSGDGTPAKPKAFLVLENNPELAFTFSVKPGSATGEGGYMYYCNKMVAMAEICLGASKDVAGALMNLYGTGDRRANHWFSQYTGVPGGVLGIITHTPMKYGHYDKIEFTQAMRTGEVYLNVAEAYMKQAAPNPAKALQLMNDLRRNRIAAANYAALTTADFTGNDEILDFVLEERRRELCFEEFHRWWDLRRNGMPEIIHCWKDETYTLHKNDVRYVLDFPKAELDYAQGVLIPNPRNE